MRLHFETAPASAFFSEVWRYLGRELRMEPANRDYEGIGDVLRIARKRELLNSFAVAYARVEHEVAADIEAPECEKPPPWDSPWRKRRARGTRVDRELARGEKLAAAERRECPKREERR